jgi:hypothetical protein
LAFWFSQIRLLLVAVAQWRWICGNPPARPAWRRCWACGVGSPSLGLLSTHRRLLQRRCGAAKVCWRLGLEGGGGCCCCGDVEVVGGSGRRLFGGLASSPEPVLKGLGGFLRLMRVHRQDPVLRGWWLLRFFNAFWLGASSVPRCGRLGRSPSQRRRRSLTPLRRWIAAVSSACILFLFVTCICTCNVSLPI